MVIHCQLVKQLMDHLAFLYSGKDNITRVFDVCNAFYRADIQDKSLLAFYMDYKKTYAELNIVLLFSEDITV